MLSHGHQSQASDSGSPLAEESGADSEIQIQKSQKEYKNEFAYWNLDIAILQNPNTRLHIASFVDGICLGVSNFCS